MNAVPTDFNDMARERGPEAVRERIEAARDPIRATGRSNLPTLESLGSRFTPEELAAAPEPRTFAVVPLIPDARVAVLNGAGGTSKTGVCARLGVGVVLGEPVFGLETDRGRVVYVTAEDRCEDLRRHLHEILRGRPESDLRAVFDGLLAIDVVGLDFKLVRVIDGAPTVTQQAQELASVCAAFGARLCIVDTCSRVNGASEDNEGLSRVIEACELVTREAGCAVLLTHHVGKAQMRAGIADQYGGRGGTALSDNARSVLHLAVVTDQSKAPVADAAALVADGRLLVLSHVKANLSMRAPDIFIAREQGAYAATLRRLPTLADADPIRDTWRGLARWLAEQKDVAYPTRATVDDLDSIGRSRADRRRAVRYALDRELVAEVTHPKPTRNARTYLLLAPDTDNTADAYKAASDGR